MVDPYTCTSLVPLGCVCFGFKSFLEILFCKCGCLFAYGKWIFRKRILVDRKIKAFDLENIFCQNFTFKSFPKTHKERKRERKDSRANREREREREREIANPKNPRSLHREPMNRKSHCADCTGESHSEPTNPRTRYRSCSHSRLKFL